jgi:hypothetical protein
MMAQIVTVPLGLTRPAMLRSPSAAADHGWPVAAFSPVGNPNREAGPVAEAIPLHEQTLTACERVLGPDHTYTPELAEQPRRLPGGAPD